MPPKRLRWKWLLAICLVLGVAGLRADDQQADMRLDFTEVPVVDVLHYYEHLSGKKVVYDDTVKGQITVRAKNVTRSQVAALIEDALRLQGIAATPSADGTTVKFSQRKDARVGDYRGYRALLGLAKGEPLATRVFKLKYVDAEKAWQAMAEYEAPSALVSYEVIGSNQLLVTARKGTGDRVAARLLEIDVPGPYHPAPQRHRQPAKPTVTPGTII